MLIMPKPQGMRIQSRRRNKRENETGIRQEFKRNVKKVEEIRKEIFKSIL